MGWVVRWSRGVCLRDSRCAASGGRCGEQRPRPDGYGTSATRRPPTGTPPPTRTATLASTEPPSRPPPRWRSWSRGARAGRGLHAGRKRARRRKPRWHSPSVPPNTRGQPLACDAATGFSSHCLARQGATREPDGPRPCAVGPSMTGPCLHQAGPSCALSPTTERSLERRVGQESPEQPIVELEQKLGGATDGGVGHLARRE